MTREQLEGYRSKKAEIKELEARLLCLADDVTGNSTIMDYRSGYPVPQSLVGVDKRKYWKRRDRYKCRIEQLERECEETEEYIENIQDSLTRRIFRMHFIEGNTLEKVGNRVGLEKSSVSKRIKRYIKLSTSSTNSIV